MSIHRSAELSALEEFCAWTAADLASSEAHVATLEARHCGELRSVLPGLKARKLEAARLRRADVPFAGLTAVLAEWRDAVIYGRGFVLLRRLPIERMSDGDIGLSLCALSAHLGQIRPEGAGTGPVPLVGEDAERPLSSGAEGDVTALLCLNEPPQGFELGLASAVAVHNLMLAEAPELLSALYERGQNVPPAFACAEHRLFARLAPQKVQGGGRRDRALAFAVDCAERTALKMDFEPGDLLFVNNHHALFGLTRRGAPSRFGAQGRLLRLSLSSPLIGKRPALEEIGWQEAGSQAA